MQQFSYSKISKDHTVIYKVVGEFKSYYLQDLKKEVQNDIVENKDVEYHFDLSETSYVDTEGITILVMAGRMNHQKGKKLKIINPNDHIKSIIQTADLIFVEFTQG